MITSITSTDLNEEKRIEALTFTQPISFIFIVFSISSMYWEKFWNFSISGRSTSGANDEGTLDCIAIGYILLFDSFYPLYAGVIRMVKK